MTMAVLDQNWIEAIQKRIRDSELVNKSLDVADKVKAHIDGDTPMTKSQLEGAKVFAMLSKNLLAKVAPDVKSIEVKGADGGPLQHNHTVEFINGSPAATK